MALVCPAPMRQIIRALLHVASTSFTFFLFFETHDVEKKITTQVGQAIQSFYASVNVDSSSKEGSGIGVPLTRSCFCWNNVCFGINQEVQTVANHTHTPCNCRTASKEDDA